jgi:predicted RNA polymerase sigma factor
MVLSSSVTTLRPKTQLSTWMQIPRRVVNRANTLKIANDPGNFQIARAFISWPLCEADRAPRVSDSTRDERITYPTPENRNAYIRLILL